MIPHVAQDDEKKRLHEQARTLHQQGLGYRRISAQTGYSISQVRRILGKLPEKPTGKRKLRSAKGAPTHTLQRVEIPGEVVVPVNGNTPAHPNALERINASERIASALSDHESRITMLEALVATLQQQAHQSASERTNASAHSSTSDYIRPTDFFSTGVQVSRARFEQLKAYALAHRLQVREAMDMALGAFLAVGGEQ